MQNNIDRRLAFRVTVATSLVLVVIIAFFTQGGTHGLYADDYVYKSADCAWSAGSAGGIVEHRIAAISLAGCLAGLLPEYELPVRVGIIVVHLLNVLLLAWLAWRLTGSSLVTLLSGGLYLVPLLANEGLVWFSGAVFYTLPLSLLLAGLHLALASLTFRTFPGQYIASAGALVLWLLMALFIEAGLLVPLLVPLLVWMASRRGLPVHRRAALVLVGLYAVAAGAYLMLVVRTAPIVALHGETVVDPVYILGHRVPETLDSLGSYLGQWQTGGPMFDALELGLHEWLGGAGIFVLAALVLGLALVAALAPASQPAPDGDNTLPLMALGLGWTALTVAPVLFIANLTVSSRVLLMPWAGISLALAGFCGWLVKRAGRFEGVAARVILVTAGVVLIVNALAMAGITRVYQLRWDLDQKQVRMFNAALPQPRSPVWLLPLDLNNHSVSAYWNRGTVLDKYLFGLFQVPWAARPALATEYPQAEIQLVDRDMQGHVHLIGFDRAADGRISRLTFRGAGAENQVPVDQLVAFTFRQDHLVLFNPLTITGPAGRVELDLHFARTMPGVVNNPFELTVEQNP